MTTQSASAQAQIGTRGLWAYNVRILLGNSYWLIVTPIAAAQLVLFWNMATATLFSQVRAAQTVELLAPILGAFLCAHVLAPEQAGVREMVFARPISFEKILAVRLAVMFAFVLVVLVPALLLYQFGIEAFPLGLTLLAGLPSMLFLSLLAMGVAAASGNPLLGLGVAGAYWVLDLAKGADLNALITLQAFAAHLRSGAMSDQWVTSKLVLLAFSILLYLWHRRLLGRPPGPRRWATAVRTGLVTLLIIVLYFASGAAYKVAYGMGIEGQLGNQALLWYKRQFAVYGPLPVTRLFGPAFALYVQPHAGARPGSSWTGPALPTPEEIARMKRLVERYPDSPWADNAAFEIARDTSRYPASQSRTITLYDAAGGHRSDLIEADLEGSAKAFADLAARYPDSPFAPLALEQSAEHALSLLDFERAMAGYEQILRKYPSAPEAHAAGLALSALYLRQGRWQESVSAADRAAAAAPWEARADAILAAAQAAEHAGQAQEARERYQRAHAAAKQARADASARRRITTGISGGQVVLRSDAVMRACEQALARDINASRPAPPPPGVAVTGRVERDGEGVPDVRVALAMGADPTGRVSPFLPTPAVQTATGKDGAFRLAAVPPGAYSVVAFACPNPAGQPPLEVARPSLPIEVGTSPVLLDTFYLVPRVVVRPPPPGPPPGSGEGLEQWLDRQSATTRERGGGRGGERGALRGGPRGGDRTAGRRGGGGTRRGGGPGRTSPGRGSTGR